MLELVCDGGDTLFLHQEVEVSALDYSMQRMGYGMAFGAAMYRRMKNKGVMIRIKTIILFMNKYRLYRLIAILKMR